jgi:hypothetical protein
MKTKRTLTIATVLVALTMLTTLSVLQRTRKVQAQDQLPPPVGDRISFGMIGITQGQTIRLSVVNTEPPPIGDSQPQAQRVVLTFLDSEGHFIHNNDRAPVRKVVMLQPGKASFLDLNADDLQLPPGPIRLQLRAVVNAAAPPSSNLAPPFVSSVEVINNANGRTVFALSSPPAIRQQPPPVND